MKRFLQIILTLAVALNLTAAAASAGNTCNKPCCERELAKEIALACSNCGPSVGEPPMGCCGSVSQADETQATLNTGSVLPTLDIASLAGELPVRFARAAPYASTNHSTGPYESPPIFILNASFIC